MERAPSFKTHFDLDAACEQAKRDVAHLCAQAKAETNARFDRLKAQRKGQNENRA